MRNTDPSAATVQLVRNRDEWRCVRCGRSDRGLTTQHRIARKMGGTLWAGINLPSNLITLCGHGTAGCHGWVEAMPRTADAHGWSLPSWSEPQAAPVRTWQGWVQLDNHGGMRRLPDHGGVADCDCGCRPRVRSDVVWL